MNKDDFALAAQKVQAALVPGGVFCMTLKEADEYGESVQEDEFGTRLFYLYPPQLVQDLVGPSFKLIRETHQVLGAKRKKWMCLMFVKQ